MPAGIVKQRAQKKLDEIVQHWVNCYPTFPLSAEHPEPIQTRKSHDYNNAPPACSAQWIYLRFSPGRPGLLVRVAGIMLRQVTLWACLSIGFGMRGCPENGSFLWTPSGPDSR